MADRSTPHAVIAGTVRAGRRTIQGVLVEAFDAPVDLESRLPLDGRRSLINEKFSRLGSCITDSSGRFVIDYEVGSAKPNVWLAASSCCQDTDGTNQDTAGSFLYQADQVRARAGQREEYAICLSNDYEDALNPIDRRSIRTMPALMEQAFAAETASAEVGKKISSERLNRRKKVLKEFKAKIAPEIKKHLSLVELDKDGKAADPEYVGDDEHIRTKAEERMVAAIRTNLATGLSKADRLAAKGRMSLTPDQLKQLEEVGTLDEGNATITVDEWQLRSALQEENGNGINSEDGTQIVNRVNAIAQFCFDQGNTNECLRHVTENNEVRGNGHTEEVAVVEVEGPHDDEDQEDDSPPVTVDMLKANLPSYIAAVLDEASVLDPGKVTLPAPGQQLTQEEIGSHATFPSLTLPPGPADVPAYHDFYDLQIAFKPVWMEAIDESVVGNAQAVYERYVENGGDADDFWELVTMPEIGRASCRERVL